MRLTIHLHKADKQPNGKVYATLAFRVKDEGAGNKIVKEHGDNVKKHYYSNIN